MIQYRTQNETVASAGTITINGRPNRTVQVTHMLINGVGVETINATIVYNTAAGDAIVCKPLTQVTAAANTPTQLDFNDQDDETFPIVINEDESLVLTCTSSAAGAMTFAITLRVDD